MIFLEDRSIKLNGVLLPGVVKKIEIKSTARIDEQEVKGSAVKPKQATGYEDAKITIDLILDDTPTQTKYQRLAVLRNLFRKPGQGVPKPIPIVNQDTAAHGISKVLFQSITHAAESKSGQLPVTLEFWEYIPQTIKTTKSKKKDAAPAKSANAKTALNSKYKSYLKSGRGAAPTQKATPAVDNASTTKATAGIFKLRK